jgi:hypothetical protein
MQWRFWIALCGILIAIGFAVGFATAQFLYAQSATASISGFIVSIVPIIGAGVVSLGLFQAWNRSRKEDERIPVLEFDGFFLRRQSTIRGGDRVGFLADMYCVRVRRTNGLGNAEQCEGVVSLLDSPLDNMFSRWIPDNVRESRIGGHLDLFLFQTILGEEIVFSPVSPRNEIAAFQLPLEPHLDRPLSIEIHSRNARTPEPLRVTVGQIMNEARTF